MYEIECIENRIKVFKDGSEYLEMDQPTPVACKRFVEDYEELLDALPTLDDETLESILSTFNADYNGVIYRKDKVGDFIKTDKGQLTFEL
ncbi:MAG: hypothetical protein II453_04775 [Alphaproteobacteria bacterium]|nr:hypothetical protein [Alphaproteobacteria bacterium]